MTYGGTEKSTSFPSFLGAAVPISFKDFADAGHNATFPRIVVVGDENSGKSSLLQRVAGQNVFPDDGCLGHGEDLSNQLLPKKVEAFAGQRFVVAVAAGVYHSIAITADGAIFTWGEGGRGCLGHGEDLSNQLMPKKVEAWPPSTLASS